MHHLTKIILNRLPMWLHNSLKVKVSASLKATVIALSLSTLVTGCGTLIKPDELRTPTTITCINLPTPISFIAERGLLNIKWETRLERGPYISEKEDDQGTYYRAFPGGVNINSPGRFSIDGKRFSNDGGFWIPHDHSALPRIYTYFSGTPGVPMEIPAENADCSSSAYIKDPTKNKISLVEFATTGATGGALGGVLGQSLAQHSGMSYGQAAGAGAVGGGLGMLIVGAMINADVGKIYLYPSPPEDVAFTAKLKELADQAIQLKEMPVKVTPDLK